MSESTPENVSGKRDWIIAVAAAIAGTVATKGLDWLGNSTFPWWAYVVGAGVALLILTFVLPNWRKTTWGNVAKWRPLTTAATLQKARTDGRGELEAELEANKYVHIIRPQWVIISDKEDQFLWKLLNTADRSIAKEVSLHVDNSVFLAGSAMDWSEVIGTDNVVFKGAPTQAGHDFGVPFIVVWTDKIGRRQQSNVSWERYGY
ncbi:hypothetical protein [Glaciihabitans sp. UYNi722]|uniref:hypothetical protein n=1 Tax=Glaciihabitans sp. UYNi722 TaxID=3156344 RepID=UPI003397D42C